MIDLNSLNTNLAAYAETSSSNELALKCRETLEETGLTLTSYRLRGIITFISDRWEGEYMYLYTADGFTGEMISCDEGDLEWVPKDQVLSLPIWEGDRMFFQELLLDRGFFTMKCRYEGDRLVDTSFKLH